MSAERKGSTDCRTEEQVLIEDNTLGNEEQVGNITACGEDILGVSNVAENIIQETLVEDEGCLKVPQTTPNHGRRFSIASLRSGNARRMEHVPGGQTHFSWNCSTIYLLVLLFIVFIVILFNIYIFSSLL